LSGPVEKGSWAREVLVRYGERADVRENLQANFSTEGWVGGESEHYSQKRRGLEGLRANETNPKVQSWLDEFIDVLSNRIELARVREERDEF
jgi:hypothetical protein